MRYKFQQEENATKKHANQFVPFLEKLLCPTCKY